MAAQITGKALNPQNLISYDINTSSIFATVTVPLYQQISSGSYTLYIEPNSDIYMATTDRGNLITNYFSFSTASQALLGTSNINMGLLQSKNDFNYLPLITRTTPFNSAAQAVAWNGSIWVAVGSGFTTVASSVDGISWVPRDMNTVITSAAFGVTWNGSLWIVVGNSGATVGTNIVSTSPDGIIWTGRGSFVTSAGVNPVLGKIAWNGSIFVAGDNSIAKAYTSTDAITWIERNRNYSQAANIVWNGSLFILLPGTSIASTIEISPDGINWTGISASYAGIEYWYGAAWSPSLGLWVIAGWETASYPGYLMYSYNGFGWTGAGPSSAAYTLYDVQWNGTNFVAAGITYLMHSTTGTTFTSITHGLGTIYSLAWSPSLSRWVAVTNGAIHYTNTVNGSSGWTTTSFTPFTGAILNTVAWSPELRQFVAVGQAGTHTIAYSYDGITWVGLGATFLTFTTAGTGIRWSPQLGLWCATGNGTNTFLTSPNGINWTPRGTTGVDNTGRAIAWSPQQNQFVMGGTGRHSLATSSGGVLWVGRTGTSIFSTQVNGVAWAAQLNTWIAVGSGTNTIASSQDGISWTPRVPVSLAALTSTGNCVAWNGSLFVAGGSGTNQIATSIDGVNWTGRSQAVITGTVFGITWSPTLSLWVATGSTTNTVATSPDGITWTGRGSIFSTQGNAVAWSPPLNQFVACGQGTNTLATSADGSVWTGMTAPSTYVSNPLCVVWNGQQWVSVGTGTSRIATSPDGFTWTNRTSIQTTSVNSVAWNDSPQLGTTNGGLYVAVGQGTAVFSSSLDGITWTGRGSTGISNIGNAVCWYPYAGIWVAVGNGTNCIATGTADATTWTGYTGTSIFSSSGFGVAAGPTLVVAVGQGTSAIASSPDGVTWTQRSATNVIFSIGRGVAYAPTLGVWVAVGTPATHSIAYSTNGTTWIGVTGTTIFSTQGNYVTWNGSFFIAVGQGTNVEATSWNGINWRPRAPGQAITQLLCAGTRPTIMVAGGNGTNTLATSWDGGITWAPRGIGIFSTGCYCVAWNGNIWVAGGQGTNTFATSTDGVNWTGRGSLIITTSVYGLVWANSLNLWVAVGAGTNQIATSFDGVTWVARGGSSQIFTSGFANAIGWNGSLFVATGGGTYSIAISRDGFTWVPITNTNPSNPNNQKASAGIAWNGNVWALGTSGTANIYSSPDGIYWTSRLSAANGISSITWNGSLFLATPYRRTDGQYFTSPDGITWTTYTATIDGTINPFVTQGIFSSVWNPYSKVWTLCGYDNPSATNFNGNMIITNPDATNAGGWTSRMSYPISVSNVGVNGVSWDPVFNRWVAIPNNGGGALTASGMLTSATGSGWTSRTQLYSVNFAIGQAVAYSITNACHVAVAQASTTSTSIVIWYSINGGITWISATPTTLTTTTYNITGLVWAPALNLWVIVGQSFNGSVSVGIIYTSTDVYARSSWVTRSTGGTIFGGAVNGVAWNGSNLFVAVGLTTNVFASSTDGITWTGRGLSGITSQAYGVCWSAPLNLWIAVGNGTNSIATGSANAVTWTGYTTTTIFTTGRAVATNGVIIVAVGTGNFSIAYSYNGTVWYGVPNSSTLFFATGRAVAWNGSLWVATGQGVNFTATSPDGVNWTAGRSFTTNANTVAFQSREKTFTISNTQWTGRTSQQTFRILG
jgi:hypothetical protein